MKTLAEFIYNDRTETITYIYQERYANAKKYSSSFFFLQKIEYKMKSYYKDSTNLFQFFLYIKKTENHLKTSHWTRLFPEKLFTLLRGPDPHQEM